MTNNLRDQTWATAVWAAFHAGELTRTHRDVLLTLETYCRSGQGWPSHATLAARTACSEKTVGRALARGRELGLVDWRAVRWSRGARWVRLPNRYRLIRPQSPVDIRRREPRRNPMAPRYIGQRSGAGERSVYIPPAENVPVAEQWIKLAALGVPLPEICSGSTEFQRAMGW